jgi:hypothetical protein
MRNDDCCDDFFTAAQQQRLSELMSKWRTARDSGGSLPLEEQSELESLVEAELLASAERAKRALSGRLRSSFRPPDRKM